MGLIIIKDDNRLELLSFCFFGLFFLVLFWGCRSGVEGDSRVGVVVSVEPHAFLVERIGGEFVRVQVLVPVGKEPESYQPVPEKIVALTQAKLFFRTGIPFENIIIPKLKSIAPNLEIIDLRHGINLRKIEFHHHKQHEHEFDKNNTTTEQTTQSLTNHPNDIDCLSDPHIWFSVRLLLVEAESVLRELVKIDPLHESEYKKNFEAFVKEAESVKTELNKILKPLKGQTIFVFHPTYGYFCDEFNLHQQAIEIGGKTPKPKELVAIINKAAEIKNKTNKQIVIFVQPEFNRTPAQSVAEATNGRIVEHSALERNIFKSMINFAKEICGDDSHEDNGS
ncbi:MAG: zinc ABC transporter substrate-binding protein [Planctomycetaceae bacterium]|jgi:zinc transport system substrate-binding protein|nr:zinc ABC transporter substrate-binding protein [Planctomycetaceae bacterium]